MSASSLVAGAVAPVVSSLVWFFILRRRVAAAYRRGYRDGHSVGYPLGRADQLHESSEQFEKIISLSRRFYSPDNEAA